MASQRGFGSMDKDKQREIARKGGQSSHQDSQERKASGSTRGGTHEQHVKAGRQSHKNT